MFRKPSVPARLAVLVSILVLAAGWGAASASAQPPVTTAHTIVLTNASNGSTVTAAKGDVVVVELTGGPLRWSEASAVSPTAAPTARPVLIKEAGSVSADGSSITVFLVASNGVATLQAAGTPICLPGSACPTYVALWQATVVVPVLDPLPVA